MITGTQPDEIRTDCATYAGFCHCWRCVGRDQILKARVVVRLDPVDPPTFPRYVKERRVKDWEQRYPKKRRGRSII